MVIAMDGTPFSFLKMAMDTGVMPRLAREAARGSFRRIRSVYPTVSSCAWASFMTGLDPGGHAIYGFIDRRPETWDLYIPTGKHIAAETLWEKLSRLGKRVVVINVPGTYPPREVNGVMIGCFLCTDIGKVSRDPRVVEYLRSIDYRIDVDAWNARKSLDGLLDEVRLVMDRRAKAALHFCATEPWDFFMVHFMAMDRMQHFAWAQYAEGDAVFHPGLLDVYRRLDAHLGSLLDAAGPDVEFAFLSDHGFCSIKQEVQVNRWLEEEGYLVLREGRDPKAGLRAVDPARTRAYSLIPGRIFLNLKGREGGGIVEPGEPYENLRRELTERLMDWKDPADGTPILGAVMGREDIYHGPQVHRAADLIAHPTDGYDLKGRVAVDSIFERTPLTGMHTYDDAFLLMADSGAPTRDDLAIPDAYGLFCDVLGVDREPRPLPA
jgi:predicted AlkP superfamily phosphohydrolase/phosphomutase